MLRLFIIVFAFALAVPAQALAHYEGELLPDSVAVMEYSMIINMAPNDVLTRNKLGMVYIRQGKLDKAKEQFLEILKLNPGDFDALDSLGIVSDKEGRYAEAVEWYKKAIKARSNDAGVRQRCLTAEERLKGVQNR